MLIIMLVYISYIILNMTYNNIKICFYVLLMCLCCEPQAICYIETATCCTIPPVIGIPLLLPPFLLSLMCTRVRGNHHQY